MTSSDYAALCQRILEYYQRKQIYGPGLHVSDHSFDHDIDEPWLEDSGPTSPFPVATEDQVRHMEAIMGFSYPPLLRYLYLHCGNGGFGPGFGLVGVYCEEADRVEADEFGGVREYILHKFVSSSTLQDENDFDLEQLEALHGILHKIELHPFTWPTHLICLCDWGCGFSSYLHAKTGRVYYCGEKYLIHQANSLQEWLERWMKGENLEHVCWD